MMLAYISGDSTTLDKRYGVSRRNNSVVDFNGCDLPIDWDTLSTTLDVCDDLRTKLGQRSNMQCAFDQEPLTKRICWKCGHVIPCQPTILLPVSAI